MNNSEPVDEMNKDKDYEQGDEVDDEATMEEEEALPELEDPLREIRFLEEVIYICKHLSEHIILSYIYYLRKVICQFMNS